jgi:hypothetical protein
VIVLIHLLISVQILVVFVVGLSYVWLSSVKEIPSLLRRRMVTADWSPIMMQELLLMYSLKTPTVSNGSRIISLNGWTIWRLEGQVDGIH